MTIAPALPRSFRSRLAWAIADAWVITGRDLAHWARQPGTVIANTLLFPLMIVLMFGYLLGGAMTVPGGGDYRDFLMPGMFAMTMVFGIGATVTAVSADAARGVTDRFRAHAHGDVGRHRRAGRLGIYLGLTFYSSPEAVTAVRTLEFPIGFLGNPFVAIATMPVWIAAIAQWNPLSSTVSAARQLFGDPTGAHSSWITDHAVLLAVAWPLLLIGVFFPLSLHRYGRLSR